MKQSKDPRIQVNAAALRRDLTDAENALWKELRMHQMGGIHFRRQHAIGNYVVDFCSPSHKLVIELDGGQHLEQEYYDVRRTSFLEARGYRVLRFWDHEVLTEMEEVLQVIYDTLGIVKE